MAKKSNMISDAKGSPHIAAFVASLFCLALICLDMLRLFGIFDSLFSTPAIGCLVRLILFVPVMLCGADIYICGFKSLSKLRPGLESLAALGTLTSLALSAVSMFLAALGNSEYENRMLLGPSALIIVSLLIGRCFESHTKSGEPAQKLENLLPQSAHIIDCGEEKTVPTGSLAQGDTVVVKSGESFPCDGLVLSQKVSVNEMMLTGEAAPRDKIKGDTVFAGTVNLGADAEVLVQKASEDTALCQMAKRVKLLVRSGSGSPGYSQRAQSAVFWAAASVSAAAFVLWIIFTHDFMRSFEALARAATLSCPCCMAYASAWAVSWAKNRGEKEGVIFKSETAIELAGSLNTVVLDKTGTVTVGKPFVTDVIPLGTDAEEVVLLASSLEINSSDPVASAISDYAAINDIEPLECSEFEAVEGFGMRGRISSDEVSVGKPEAVFTGSSEGYLAICRQLFEDGKTLAAVQKNGSPIGIIAFDDKIKPTSKSGIDKLTQMGIKTVMLTGDSTEAAEKVAREIGVADYAANVTPDRKAEMILGMKEKSKVVAMVGDSINDTVALAAADVGISIGSGSDAALDVAQIVLVRNDLRDVAKAVRISALAMKIMKQNLFWAVLPCIFTLALSCISPLFPGIGRYDTAVFSGSFAFSLAALAINSKRQKKSLL